MGFYPQPNDWSCGPFALKHALIALGQFTSEDRLAKLARTHWWSGTNELRLAKAAAAFGCELEVVRKRTAEAARKELNSYLRSRIPTLLCVDDWGHWICVLRAEGNQYVVVDSNEDPVLDIVTWPQLHRRWRYLDYDYDDDVPPELYDLLPVVPRSHARMRADFSTRRVRFLRRAQNRGLARHWDEYVEDLAAICRPRHGRMYRPLSMAEFLRRNEELIASRVLYWHGDVAAREIAALLDHYQFVAETYGLVIPTASARRAVVDLTILTTLWVAAARGVGPMYGAEG